MKNTAIDGVSINSDFQILIYRKFSNKGAPWFLGDSGPKKINIFSEVKNNPICIL